MSLQNIVFNQLNFAGLDATMFYGFLLPWIFSFAIVYGLLSKLTIFGKDQKVNVALAFVIAFFVTGVGGPQLASFFTTLFGGASVFLAGILVVVLFVAILGRPTELNKTAAVIVVIILGVLLFLASSGNIIGRVYISGATASLIFWLIIIIVAAYLITRPEGHGSGGGGGGAPGKKPGE